MVLVTEKVLPNFVLSRVTTQVESLTSSIKGGTVIPCLLYTSDAADE